MSVKFQELILDACLVQRRPGGHTRVIATTKSGDVVVIAGPGLAGLIGGRYQPEIDEPTPTPTPTPTPNGNGQRKVSTQPGVCDVCGNEYSSLQGLAVHRFRRHGLRANDPTPTSSTTHARVKVAKGSVKVAKGKGK